MAELGHQISLVLVIQLLDGVGGLRRLCRAGGQVGHRRARRVLTHCDFHTVRVRIILVKLVFRLLVEHEVQLFFVFAHLRAHLVLPAIAH